MLDSRRYGLRRSGGHPDPAQYLSTEDLGLECSDLVEHGGYNGRVNSRRGLPVGARRWRSTYREMEARRLGSSDLGGIHRL